MDLRERGYRVLEASGGAEALRLAEDHRGQIHLLVTDVVMPQMSGPELARELGEHRAELKVLYTSGYTDKTIVHHGVFKSKASFLQKPYISETLLGKVRSVLDQPPSKPARTEDEA